MNGLRKMMMGSLLPPTPPPPSGSFTLSMSFGTAFTSLSGTGLPTFSFPTGTTGTVSELFFSTIPAQTLTVGISAPSTTIRLDLVVDGIVVNSYPGITTSGTYNLTLPSSVADTSTIEIQVNT